MAGRGWRHLAGFLVLLLCAYQLCLRPALAASPDEESALRALSAAWDGANVLGWNPADDVCTWDHVTCDTNGAVVALNIATANITGTLPGQLLTGLSNLQRLDLTLMPGLGGTIPSELGQLTSLTDLNLQNCNFSGQIPVELSQLANTLSFLALNDNQLTGPIPPELGNLSLVWWFDVSSNQLSEEIPESTASAPGLDSLINAKHLHLNNNSLGGSIPTKICSLPKLIHLLLDSNRLGGPIPAEIGNFTNLVILRLQNNNFNGQIPKEISQITSLQELHLNDNLLTGTLPDFSTLRNLQLLDVSNNRFSSQPFPNALQDFTYLLTLAASNANLTGQLPSFVLGLPTLESLTLSNNALNGSLQFINVGKQLTSVLLDNNRIESITGTVPPDIQFQEFSIQSNPVCTNGQNNYPRDWCSAALARPYLKSTTCGLKTCADTKSLNPSNCACFFVLSIIIQLTSPSFTTIDGVRVQQLERLLAQNTSTQVVVVNATFTQNGRLLVETEFFGVDGRDLEFKIANSIVTSLTNQKIELPGFAPYLVAAPPYPVFPPRSLPGTSHPLGVGAIIGIVAAALAVGLIVAAIAFYALRQKKRAEKAEEMSKPFAAYAPSAASWPGGKAGESGGAPKLKGARWFSFSELKKATSNFSDSNEIGVGGYGKVYKGRLESGEEVAIKRAQEGSMQGQTEFKNEIELLSRVHHRNLVGLVGFCYEQGEQMLVYEYMPKGTMRDHLMGKSPAPLHWSKRLSIALGSARGIAYLHELANPPIIHRDIKSSNILLDEKLIAKVADFGLSKLAPDGGGKAHVSTQVKGTLGYLDPEYYMTQQLSDKSDVYSFGVVLLELLTARQPIERGKYIVREVKTALDRGGMSAFRALLDPFLTDYNAHDLKTFLDLALRCVEEAAADRPTMTEVARDLEVLVGHNYPESGQVSINDTGKSNDSVSSHEQEYQMPRPR